VRGGAAHAAVAARYVKQSVWASKEKRTSFGRTRHGDGKVRVDEIRAIDQCSL
jgi:hypothetical protein